MAETPKRKRKPGQSRRPRRSETVYYVVALKPDEWAWGLSFGVSSIRRDEGPYADYRHLHLQGSLIRPRKVRAESVRLVLLPDTELDLDKRAGHEPKSVGRISLRRREMEILVSLPADALTPVLQTVIAGRIRFAIIAGEPLYRGNAGVVRYSLAMTYEEEGLPPDQ